VTFEASPSSSRASTTSSTAQANDKTPDGATTPPEESFKPMPLTPAQIQNALRFNTAHLPRRCLPNIRIALGLPGPGTVDEAFVQAVATFQQANLSGLPHPPPVDGRVDHRTEGHLGVQHPKALDAVRHARQLMTSEHILFDSWGNDLRDNGGHGTVDGNSEQDARDGSHYGTVYSNFSVVAGSYQGGWGARRPRRHAPLVGGVTVRVPASRTITGRFKYMVCADLASLAFERAHVITHLRSTGEILDAFRRIGWVWNKLEHGLPREYLPGDFIATYDGTEGHSGVVVERTPTTNNPMVVELPGPSTSIDMHDYDPTQTSDVREERWSKGTAPFRGIRDADRYLGRALTSRLA
jgi:hypothetical protein